MFEVQSGDGGAHGVGAIAGAVIGVDALSFDAVSPEEGQGGVEEGDGAASAFIWDGVGRRVCVHRSAYSRRALEIRIRERRCQSRVCSEVYPVARRSTCCCVFAQASGVRFLGAS